MKINELTIKRIIKEAGFSLDVDGRKKFARNTTNSDALDFLARKDNSTYVLSAIAENKNTRTETLEYLYKRYKDKDASKYSFIINNILENPNSAATIIPEAIKEYNNGKYVNWYFVIRNPNVTFNMLPDAIKKRHSEDVLRWMQLTTEEIDYYIDNNIALDVISYQNYNIQQARKMLNKNKDYYYHIINNLRLDAQLKWLLTQEYFKKNGVNNTLLSQLARTRDQKLIDMIPLKYLILGTAIERTHDSTHFVFDFFNHKQVTEEQEQEIVTTILTEIQRDFPDEFKTIVNEIYKDKNIKINDNLRIIFACYT